MPHSSSSSQHWGVTTYGVPASHVVCHQDRHPGRWLAVCSAWDLVTSEKSCSAWHVSMVTCSPWIWVWTVLSCWLVMTPSRRRWSRMDTRCPDDLKTSSCLRTSAKEKVNSEPVEQWSRFKNLSWAIFVLNRMIQSIMFVEIIFTQSESMAHGPTFSEYWWYPDRIKWSSDGCRK